MTKQIMVTVDDVDYVVKLDIKMLSHMALKPPADHRVENREQYDERVKGHVLLAIQDIFDEVAI